MPMIPLPAGHECERVGRKPLPCGGVPNRDAGGHRLVGGDELDGMGASHDQASEQEQAHDGEGAPVGSVCKDRRDMPDRYAI